MPLFYLLNGRVWFLVRSNLLKEIELLLAHFNLIIIDVLVWIVGVQLEDIAKVADEAHSWIHQQEQWAASSVKKTKEETGGTTLAQ